MNFVLDALSSLSGFGDSSSSSWFSSSQGGSGWSVKPENIAGIVIYSIVFIITIGMYAYKRYKTSLPCQSMSTIFYIGLPSFMLLRVIWFVLDMYEPADAVAKILNRLCFCVFLFVFNALLFYWVDTVHTTVNATFAKEAFKGTLDYEYMTKGGRIFFWGSTVLVILLTMTVAFVRQALLDKAEKQDGSEHEKTMDTANVLYDVNNMIISCMFLVYAGCFLFYGTKLNCRIRQTAGAHKSDIVKAEVFSVLLFACFAVRFVMFSYRIITGAYIDNIAFTVLTYMVPEVLPTLLCLWSVNTAMFDEADTQNASTKDKYSNFVDPLLQENEEDQ